MVAQPIWGVRNPTARRNLATELSDTIFALSSGTPPCGVAVLRISGPRAGEALSSLTGALPTPRRASLRQVRDPQAGWLDESLVLWFPGPDTATGEDCAEIHCHGGRAVIAAIERSLATNCGLRRAQPGEFTRRAFQNGRMDLLQAEALGDMLSAETELQRAVLASSLQGSASAQVSAWREGILGASAAVEQELDFSDDDQDGEAPSSVWRETMRHISGQMETWLAAPSASRLREGLRIVLAGPPNSGKSSLFNALLDESAAIVSPIAGTTRDAIERPIAFLGVPFLLVDTAGLRSEGADQIERIGISRAHEEVTRADIVLWLGPEGEGPCHALEVSSMSDLDDVARKGEGAMHVSAATRDGLRELIEAIVALGRELLPKPGQVAVSQRQRECLAAARDAMTAAATTGDLLIAGESLRQARHAMDRMMGNVATEDMLDSLFGRFCIGK